MTINCAIEIRWMIAGFDSYGFGTDKKLYNLKTGRALRQSYNSRSIGYWIGKKFYSLNKLKPLLKKADKINCPF